MSSPVMKVQVSSIVAEDITAVAIEEVALLIA